MAKKYTKLVPEGQGGSTPDRDFYYLGGFIESSGNGTAEALPIINVVYREKGNTNSVSGLPFSPNVMGGFNYFKTIPKGCEVRFYFYPTSKQASAFKYFRSEKLGFNITSVTPNANNQTDWIELNEDVLDIEGYAYVPHNSGGANN